MGSLFHELGSNNYSVVDDKGNRTNVTATVSRPAASNKTPFSQGVRATVAQANPRAGLVLDDYSLNNSSVTYGVGGNPRIKGGNEGTA
jgi:hypothetical protein